MDIVALQSSVLLPQHALAMLDGVLKEDTEPAISDCVIAHNSLITITVLASPIQEDFATTTCVLLDGMDGILLITHQIIVI